MSFAPGEAYQIAGLPLTVSGALREAVIHSRMLSVRVYFAKTQELVFTAHSMAEVLPQHGGGIFAARRADISPDARI